MAIVINGSGTVTGLAVGGLPDGTVDADTLASGAGGVDGISSTADATAMTISSSEKVGIGTTSPQGLLSLQHSNTTAPSGANDPTASAIQIHNTGGVNAVSAITFTGADHSGDGAMASIYAKHTNVTENSESSSLHFLTAHNEADVNALEITSDGRGVSQFTAKGWAQWDGATIADSHNVSSVANPSTGKYTVNWDVDMADGDYAIGTAGHADRALGMENQPTTADCDLVSYSTSGSLESGNFQSVICFGD